MTALDALDLDLLYFLCSCAHHRCRVVRVKGRRLASLRRLRYAGLVSLDGFAPSSSAIGDWLALRNETPAGAAIPAPTHPLVPRAVDEGGGAARLAGAPPPSRTGPPSMAERARRFEEQRNTRGTPGAHGGGRERAPESGLSNGPTQQRKSRTPDTAASIQSPEVARPSVDPPTGAPTAASGVAPDDPNEARPRSERPRRDPTQAPPSPYSPEKQDFLRGVSKMQRTNRTKAEAFLDSGKTSQDAGSVSLRIEARKVEVQRAEETRLACPIEQAKTKLRRRYSPVCGAEVSGGPKGQFYVGRKLVTEVELLAMAARLAA